MGTGIIAWVIGPQMIGLVFLLVALMMKAFPPKKINNYYGYRMPSATKNQHTWDAANSYSTNYMLKAGVVLLVVGFMVTGILNSITMKDTLRVGFTYLLILASTMGGTLTMIVATEKHLGKIFDDDKE